MKNLIRVSNEKSAEENVILTIRYLQKDKPGEPVTKAEVIRSLGKGIHLSARHISRVFHDLCLKEDLYRGGRGQYWLPRNFAANEVSLEKHKEMLKLQEKFWLDEADRRTQRYNELKSQMEINESDREEEEAKSEIMREIRKKELEKAGLVDWQVIIDVSLRDRFMQEASERYKSTYDTRTSKALTEAIRLWISYIERGKDPKVQLQNEKRPELPA